MESCILGHHSMLERCCNATGIPTTRRIDTNRQSSITQSYRRHELKKKRAYEQRICEVEHASFTPLVLSACGGLTTGASTFYKRLASLLAEKREQPYSITISWLRCTLSFSLLRSAIQCIRGARSRCGLAVIFFLYLLLTSCF